MDMKSKVDYKQLEKLQKNLQDLDKDLRGKVCKEIAEIAGQQLLEIATVNTPVGQYPSSSGKQGGTLKRNWNIQENSLPNGHEVTVYNPIEYASYVEYGHRLRNGGFWEGYGMLTQGEEKVYANLPQLGEKIINKAIKERLNGKRNY